MQKRGNKEKTEKDEEVREPLLSSSNNTKVHKLFETSCGQRYLKEIVSLKMEPNITGTKN